MEFRPWLYPPYEQQATGERTMSTDPVAIARASYQAYVNKDRAAIESLRVTS